MSKETDFARYAVIMNLARKAPFSWDELDDRLELQNQIHGIEAKRSLRTFQRDLNEIRILYGVDVFFDRKLKKI